jgi:hypothetical protein
MLRKKIIFVLIAAFSTLLSSLHAQHLLHPVVGRSKSNVVIDDAIFGGGDEICKAHGGGRTTISQSIIHQGLLPKYLSIIEDISAVDIGSACTLLFTSYHIEISGCSNSNAPNDCNSSFDILFQTNTCDIPVVRATGNFLKPSSGSMEFIQFTEKWKIKSNPNCKTTFDIDIQFTENGIVLCTDGVNGCSPTVKITKTITVCSGDQGRVSSSSTPNPTTGIIDLQFEGVREGNANIQIYNNVGTLVEEISTVPTYQGKNNTQIDLSNFPAGLYNIMIRQGETMATQRIQKL